MTELVDRCEQERKKALRRPAKVVTPGDRWEQHIRRKYGLTVEDVAVMWAQQDGECAICGNDLTVKRWVIDHNHKTKKVRGLVCFFCNWKVLGIIERAGRARLLGAIRYLGWV